MRSKRAEIFLSEHVFEQQTCSLQVKARQNIQTCLLFRDALNNLFRCCDNMRIFFCPSPHLFRNASCVKVRLHPTVGFTNTHGHTWQAVSWCPQRFASCPDVVWLQMFPLAPSADEVINCQLVCVKRRPSFMLRFFGFFFFASPSDENFCALLRVPSSFT